MVKLKMFVLKFVVTLFLVLSTSLGFSKEYNVEVSIPYDAKLTNPEIDTQLKIKAMEETLYQKITADGLNLDSFKAKIIEKGFARDNYISFLEGFFLSKELILISGVNAKAETSGERTAVLKTEIDDKIFKEKFTELTENLEVYKLKNFYFSFSIDLLSDTKWDDLGVTSEESFTPVVVDSWRTYLLSNIKNFKNLIITDGNVQSVLDSNPNILDNDSVELKFNISIKKVFENSQSKKVSIEINGHYVLINPKSRAVIQSFDLPISKKEFSIKVSKEYSSALASYIFNLVKLNFKKVLTAVESRKEISETIFDLTGAKLFSDVYHAQSAIETYLASTKAKVVIKKLNLASSQFSITENHGLTKSLNLLKNMGKLPLSTDPNEQKILIFDATNNSFAITQKD